ncbi:MAG: hypothetical protein K2Y21_01450 [Phycisphaerales bacterium]|nr:hypothetical protein [Phycisphaerales bacterium]
MLEGTLPGGEPGGEAPAAEGARRAVSEEINWRGRALEAEGKLSELERALADLRSTLEQTRDALDANERRRQIEIAVAGAGAIDVETVTMLIDAAMKDRPPEELATVIEQIQRQKPFLFESRTAAATTAGAGVMSAEVSSGGDALAALAEEARATGDRRALLRYLQARRSNQ